MGTELKTIKLPKWKRCVIKIGSSIIAPEGTGCATKYLLPIANFINQSIQEGKEVIVVSSGAVAAGWSTQPQYPRNTPISIPRKQAFSAIGQPMMFFLWKQLFDYPCAQLLITQDDLLNRRRFINVKNTLLELLRLKALPIVNENDTVVVQNLKVGDNDNLSAYVADLVDADILFICSDIDGLYTGNPHTDKQATLVPEVRKINDDIYAIAGKSNNPMAVGGMETKIQAAEKATSRGIDVVILHGKKAQNFDLLTKGKVIGTLFHRTMSPRAAKKHWILHVLPSSGEIVVDEGAAKAILLHSASLLPSGIVKIHGKFDHGDAVKIYKESISKDNLIAKGLTQYNSEDMRKLIGQQSYEIQKILGYYTRSSVVHRDDMVVVDTVKKEDEP
ncbi:MAG: glutamate 5-kinase [Candidatus Marinimicrobia bacterium]|nr:glutamate 5-kinase [Candidatus Neomarinimicrobiota bacterium]